MRITKATLVLGGGIAIVEAGMGADSGFDADIMIRFPGFLLAPRAANAFPFASALGGAAAEPVTATGDPAKPYTCNGNSFATFVLAATRSCNNQHNACALIANTPKNTAGITVGECDTQETQCISAANNGPMTSTSAISTSTTTSMTSTTPVVAVATTPTTPPVLQTMTPVQQTSEAAVAPVPVPVQASTPTVVASPSATLYSSDANFFYFCDP